MSVSKTRIFNMALNELGISAPIENANDINDTRAIILRNYYEIARDEVLKAFDWNFAEKYRILTPTTDECLDPRYSYVYDCPNDCISAREIFEPVEKKGCNQQISADNAQHNTAAYGLGLSKKFKVSSNESGQKILLANISPAVLRYTRKVETESYFDPEYAVALALYLAAVTATAITGSLDKASEAMKKYWDKVRLGTVSNAAEGQEADEDESTYLDYR